MKISKYLRGFDKKFQKFWKSRSLDSKRKEEEILGIMISY